MDRTVFRDLFVQFVAQSVAQSLENRGRSCPALGSELSSGNDVRGAPTHLLLLEETTKEVTIQMSSTRRE